MAVSPEAQAKIQLWRQKSREGKLTQEEMREVIQVLRQDRLAAAATSAASRERKSVAKARVNINSDELLGELDNL